MGKAMLTIMAAFAQLERDTMIERTRAGLAAAAAAANGRKGGRPRKVDDTEHIATAKRMKSDGRSHRQGHSEVPRREPSDVVSVPRRLSGHLRQRDLDRLDAVAALVAEVSQ
jgi:DNA invertase Pin-like site-specific DNA recombinase